MAAQAEAMAAGGGQAPSLTRRLALAVALVLLAGGALVAAAALAYGRQAAQQAYDRLLIGAADQIAGSINLREGAVVVDIPASAFELLALAPQDRIVYAVFDPEGRVVTGYEDLPLPARRFSSGDFAGEPVRLVRATRRFSERDFAGAVDVVVGQTLRARDALAWEIARSALLVAALIGFLMAAIAAVAVRSAVAPLWRIERGLAARDPRDLTPLDVAAPREVGALVAAINRFMRRQARQFEVMRNLIADASHQLRTPVAAMRAQAELAAEEADPEAQRAIVRRIHDRAVGMSRLTDQLLNHALIIHRADAVPHETVDLRAVAMRVAEESDHDITAAAEDLALDLPEEPVPCRADALSLVEACKNLVNNAFRHGRAPVTLEARIEGNRAVIAVRDQGPGMPDALRDRVGARYDRASGVSPGSASIGLAIVATVAAAHGGELRLGLHPSGGFEAALALPLAATRPEEE